MLCILIEHKQLCLSFMLKFLHTLCEWEWFCNFFFFAGVPLPLIGMVAYSFVAALSLQLATKENLPFGINRSSAQLVLLGSTTSMATASAYFLYILTTAFSGSSCSYCLLSVLLSFSIFFITLKVCYVKAFIIFLLFCVFTACVAALLIRFLKFLL